MWGESCRGESQTIARVFAFTLEQLAPLLLHVLASIDLNEHAAGRAAYLKRLEDERAAKRREAEERE